MELSNTTIKTLLSKLSSVLIVLFPGMVVLEFVCSLGLFSGGICNLFSFILFLIWAVVLSIPFNGYFPAITHNYISIFLKTVAIHDKQNPLIASKLARLESFKDRDKENLFIHTLIKVLIFVISFLLFKNNSSLFQFSFFGISGRYLYATISIFISILLGYPISFIITKIQLYYLKLLLKKPLEF